MSKETYHDQNANMKPNHEKKKTRPYLLTGLKMGTERAFWLMGLTSGAETMALKIDMAGGLLLEWRKGVD